MSGKVILRIGVIVLAVGLLVWLALRGSMLRQYQVVDDEYLHCAVATNVGEFTAAEAKARPGSVIMLIPDTAAAEPWTTITAYAFRNHIRVTPLTVPPDRPLTPEQAADVVGQIRTSKHLPALVISPDGLHAGKVAVAYRLAEQRRPLTEVQRLAELPDTPPEVTRELREFARLYDQSLRLPATAPGASTAPATMPAAR